MGDASKTGNGMADSGSPPAADPAPEEAPMLYYDEAGNLVDAEGYLVDEYGTRLPGQDAVPMLYHDEAGNLVDAEGNLVDEYGNLLPADTAPAADPGPISPPPALDLDDESSLVRHVDADGLDQAMDLARGRMRKKLLGAAEALDAGVARVILADARERRPLTAALEGRGTVIGAALEGASVERPSIVGGVA